ncbi:hypothetical protein SISNIDRAFT_491413 [Sistotremastrum niveocremeum HHB9708]|uniref:DUF6535 domain-containing protein n=1 Tax=Sistotremastrum niveocremeum HHB9708 TaxID=1314777 RepID=A0A164MT82_9AGAM|nr:hypothetical protein SISNIDRAFT_491413 [Sistotremastrum niveocremeum HHB9708]
MSGPSSSEQLTKPTVEPNTSTIALLGDHFTKLIAVVEKLNVTMEGQKSTMEKVESTLIDHGKKFDILTMDASKNDQPYDQKDLDDESTCMALYDMVMAKTKEKADEWKETMEVTLIFIALFSAVLTAFLVPATQALLPTSSNSGNPTSSSLPPQPPRSAEVICAFYYLSLIIAIMIAVLCALGRRWVRKLTIRPDVRTWREKMLWHIERMRRAEGWLQTLMEVIYWMLLSSIALFMGGLLYQLWHVSQLFEERASILLSTWALGVIFVCSIMLTMISTTYHAVRYQGSVFEGLISRVIVGEVEVGFPNHVGIIWTWFEKGVATGGKWAVKMEMKQSLAHGWSWIRRVKPADFLRRQGRWIQVLTRKWSKSFGTTVANIQWINLMKTMNVAKNAREWIKRNRLKIGCDSNDSENLFATYLDQIAQASDPILLDRAVASLSYQDWVLYGGKSMDQLQKAYARLMATDTSSRVKETVTSQISRFRSWIPERREQIERDRISRALGELLAKDADEYFLAREEEREKEAQQKEEEESRTIELTNFLVRQRTDDSLSPFFDTTGENCTDILDLISLPFERFVAKCLCIKDHDDIDLGDHHSIFFWSVNYCDDLLRANRRDEVTRILSHVDIFSTVRSFALAHSYYLWYGPVLKLIIADRKTDILHLLNDLLSTPRDRPNLNSGCVSAAFVIAAGSPPQLPSHLDLSPIIGHIAQHPSWVNWREISDAVIAYLVQCDMPTLSARSALAVYEFLRQCVDTELCDYDGIPCYSNEKTVHAAQTLLDQYQGLLIPLPPPSPRSESITLTEESSESLDDDSCSFPLRRT